MERPSCKYEKKIQLPSLSKSKIKSKLLNFENEATFFVIPLLLKNSLTGASSDGKNVLRL